jgi:medium-chain acyl-[acyl-carrier-protein] hydrolase
MYEQTIKVRYSEIGPDGKMGLPQILDYFQDTSTFHSEDLGVGVEYYKRMNKAWLLAAWDVEIERYPVFGETLRVITIPYGFKGFYGLRNFALCDQQNRMIVKANSTWFWFDNQKGIPARVEEEVKQAYPLGEKLEMEYRPRKILLPEAGEEREPFSVRKYQLDTNGHVNNAQYIYMAMEYVEDDFVVTQMRADYQKAATYGEVIYPRITNNENEIIIQLCNEDKNPYAIIELKGELQHDKIR